MNEIACAHRELAARVYDVAHHVNRLISDALDMPCWLDGHVQIIAHVDDQALNSASELTPIWAGQQHIIHKDHHMRDARIIHCMTICKRYQKLRGPLARQCADQQPRVWLARIDAAVSVQHLAPQVDNVWISTVMLKKPQKECFVNRWIAFL